MTETEKDMSGKSKLSFQVCIEILNLLLFYSDLTFFQV